MNRILGTTQALGVGRGQLAERTKRAGTVADGIKQSTTDHGALIKEIRRELSLHTKDGRNRNCNVRLIHTTNTDRNMEFQAYNKGVGNSTRTLETKAAIQALFDKAGWDRTHLDEYLDTIKNRGDLISGTRLLEALEKSGPSVNTAEPDRVSLLEEPDFDEKSEEEGGMSVDEALQAAGIENYENSYIDKGGFAKAYKVSYQGEESVYKHSTALTPDKYPQVTLDTITKIKPRLVRTNEVTAAYLKANQLKNVSIPTGFLVRIEREGSTGYEVVPAGKEFKNWALEQLGLPSPPTIRIAGSIMPLAAGTGLEKLIPKEGSNPSAPKLARGDLLSIATRSLDTLESFGNHGFVHGDIKPANMIYDQGSGKLTFIDTGSLTKISKDPQRLEHTAFSSKRGVTTEYSLPRTKDGKAVGHEQDLFSTGLTLLEASLKNRGASEIMAGVRARVSRGTPGHYERFAGTMGADLRSLVEKGGSLSSDSVEDLALRMIEKSLAAKKPVLREEIQGIISELRKHPSVAGPELSKVDHAGNSGQLDNPPSSQPLPVFQIGNVEAVEESGKETGGDPDQMAARLQGMKRGESYNFHVNLLQDQKAEMTGKISDYLGKSDEATLARRKEEFDRDSGRCTRTFILGSREGSDEQRIIFTSGMMPGKPPFIKNSNALEQAVKEKTPFESWQVLQDHIQPLLTQAGLALLFNGLKNEGVDLSNLRTDSSNTANPASGTNFETRIAGDGTVNVKCTHWLKPEAFDDGELINIPLDVSDSKVTQSYELEFRFSPGEGSPLGKMDVKIKSVEVEGSLARS